MGCYVIAVGGTGNKVMESIVYGACADAFYTLDDTGRRTPIEELRLLAVDVDAACGNTTRAKQAGEHYEDVRAALRRAGLPTPGFHTRLRVEKWNMNLSRRATSVEQQVRNHKKDQLLARALFNRTEASLEYSEGFRGHPDLGMLFFSELLSGLDAATAAGQPDEMADLLDAMRQEMERGETVRVILCGSIFGGTGASGIPAISQFLRERFRSFGPRLVLAAALMLPYYKVPPSTQNEELEIVVKSSAFLDKARTALSYYGMEGMIRQDENDQTGVYDAIYLLGLPQEDFVTTRIYSTGSQSQENDAHILEWLAMRCVARFFRTGFRGAQSHQIDCYYYQMHERAFSWDSFDEEGELYRVGFGGLMKAGVTYVSECYPYLRRRVKGDARGRRNAVNYYAAFFGGLRGLSVAQRATLEKSVDSLYRLLMFYCNWMCQVLRTLPPNLRKVSPEEKRRQEAEQNYALLCAQAGQLEENPDEALPDRLNDAQRELAVHALEAKQEAFTRELGGVAWLEILQNAKTLHEGRATQQRAAIEALQRRLAQGADEDGAPLDEQKATLEACRLADMRQSLERLSRENARVADDIRRAVAEDVAERYPAPKRERADLLPENELFDARLASQLYELLRLSGLPREERSPRRYDALCEALQAGIGRLIVHRVPDPVAISQIAAGLGGGRYQGADPQAAVGAFFAQLLGAVLEEDTL